MLCSLLHRNQIKNFEITKYIKYQKLALYTNLYIKNTSKPDKKYDMNSLTTYEKKCTSILDMDQ